MSRWSYVLLRPLFQEQDTLNHTAELYLDLTTAMDVPLEKLAQAAEKYRAGYRAPRFPRRAYNFAGDLILSMMVGHSFDDYPLRSAAVEGSRRAALVVSDLRSRGVLREKMAQ